jgi:RNA polymerase-binding transcription factor DksA
MSMATARKKSAPGKSAARSKPAKKAAPAKAKAAKKPAPAKAKPAAKKPVIAKAKPVAKKPLPAKAVKAAPAKPAAGKTPAKAAPAKGAAGKAAAAKPAPPAKPRVTKLVPVTAEARALAAQTARAAKPGAKGKPFRPEPEVRPLGVLPASSLAKPRVIAPARPVVKPSRPAMPARVASRPQPQRKGDERLTPEDIKYFEQRLIAERARIMGEMGHLESTVLKVNPRDSAGELSGYSYHMADAGTDSMEREKAFDIASKEGRLLLEIDDALRRVYNGSYGLCEMSGKPISRSRLEALPWARLSIEEQEKLEKEQRSGRMSNPDKE